MPRQAHPAPETLGPRARMVMRQLAGRGIRNERVLAAMRWAPREWFLPPHLAGDAYNDAPLPIGSGQTISQPYVVALMTECLAPRRTHRILEIGTGSGYQTAVLAYLAASGTVFTVERLPDLLVEAEERFRRLGLTNIETRLGDGAAGWPEEAPFDGIIVAAAAPRIPEPLTAQLAPGGRLVIPVGDLASQELVILERTHAGQLRKMHAGGVRFVPLISRLAFSAERGVPPL
jgi:protein-L-isoaspartate(D-aspartate) O-methyltransferase